MLRLSFRSKTDIILIMREAEKDRLFLLKRYALLLIIIWTAVITVSLSWEYYHIRETTMSTANVQASLAYEKDILYRKWNAEHGGVYVPITESTTPNPYLSHLPERDITPASGKKLTLINPAYMTRQVNELAQKQKSRLYTRITSLRNINPLNAPDPWEFKALQLVEYDKKEVVDLENMNGKRVMRLLVPFITNKECLKCHAQHGFKEGDIRGGISIMTDMEPLFTIERKSLIHLFIIYGMLWSAGVLLILHQSGRVIRNETARIRAEDELLKAKKLETVGLLAGGIAHDFNNSLQTICGNISLAKMFKPLDKEALGALTDAEISCEKAKELSSRLILFARGGEPVKEKIFLHEIIKETAASLVKDTDIACEYSLSEDMLPIMADERQIKQVIINIIRNAIESMPAGGIIKIQAVNEEITAKNGLPLKEGKYLDISITDHGRGIPAADLPKIFDPYFSTKDTYYQRGIGLGLAVCYSIVKKHNGLLTVESKVGAGTTFHVYLPAMVKNISKQ
jgi:signal transduction histidine kinase